MRHMRHRWPVLIGTALLFACSPGTGGGSGGDGGLPATGAGGGGSDAGATDAGATGGGSVDAGSATHALLLHVSGPGQGAVTAAGIPDCRDSCTTLVPAGSRVSLTAVASSGSSFNGWSGDCTGSGSCELLVDRDREVTATFLPVPPPPPPPPVQHAILVMRTGNGRVTSKPAGLDCGSACTAKFDEGTAVALTATADPGWQLSGFGGACSGKSCVVQLNTDATVYATFEVVPPPPPPDECAGLVPQGVPPPQVFSVPPEREPSTECKPGTTDGSGTMFLPKLTSSATPSPWTYRFVGLDGVVKGSFTDRNSDFYYFDPFEQASGFVVARYNNYTPSGEPPASVFSVSPAGVKGPPQYLGSNFFTAAINPVGGAVTADIDTFSAGSDVVSWDEGAHRRWTVHTARADWVGVDRKGATLVIRADSTPRRAFWIDPSGVAGAEFDFASQGVRLVPRVGDGFFVYDMQDSLGVGTAVAQIDSYAAQTKAAPAWLAARPHKGLHMVHGGAGYALIDPAGDVAPCSQQIEVLAPSGKSCGTASFSIANGACKTGGLTVGYDGTVIQQLPSSMESYPDPNWGAHSCTWRYWPGFFR